MYLRHVLLPFLAVSTDNLYKDILQIHTENNTNATVLILIMLETMRKYGSFCLSTNPLLIALVQIPSSDVIGQ